MRQYTYPDSLHFLKFLHWGGFFKFAFSVCIFDEYVCTPKTGADPAIKSDRSIVAEGHRRGRRPRPVGGSGHPPPEILPRKIFEI